MDTLKRTWLTGTLLALGGTAHAERVCERYVNQMGDEYQITREGPDLAVLEYLNSALRQSPGHEVCVEHEGVQIVVTTRINGAPDEAGERVTVKHLTDEWVAFPPYIDVADGSSGFIELRRGEFHGM